MTAIGIGENPLQGWWRSSEVHSNVGYIGILISFYDKGRGYWRTEAEVDRRWTRRYSRSEEETGGDRTRGRPERWWSRSEVRQSRDGYDTTSIHVPCVLCSALLLG